MPAWIHDRAEHLLAKNPSMRKSTAFALATQQSYSVGKAPKNFGTSTGRQEAKAKYDAPKSEYVKTPNPGKLDSPKMPGKPTEKSAEISPERLLIYKAMMKCAFATLEREGAKEAGAPLSPASRLAASKQVGAPRTTTPPGPSIAEIAKPKGYGRVLPGAGK